MPKEKKEFKESKEFEQFPGDRRQRNPKSKMEIMGS
jgi:hypothetical protein